MTKEQWINKFYATKLNLTKKECEEIIDEFALTIEQELTEHGECVLPGLGKFMVKATAARTVATPLTGGKPVEVPAGKRIIFKAFSGLKLAVQ